MKKIPIPQEVAEELLRILFEEIGKDGAIDEQERLIFFSFAGSLPVSRERFNLIRHDVQKRLRINLGAGQADFRTLSARIDKCLLAHLSENQYKEFGRMLMELLQSAFLSVSEKQQLTDGAAGKLLPSVQKLAEISSELDDEYMEMLRDISCMELDRELEDFRHRLIREKTKLEAARRRDKRGLAGLGTGTVIGAVFGFGAFGVSPEYVNSFVGLKIVLIPFFAFFLYKYAEIFQRFSGYSILPHTPAQIKIASGCLLSVFALLLSHLGLSCMFLVFGGVLGAYVEENRARSEEELLCNSLEQEYADYVLEPRDVLRFWNLRLQNYIREKIKTVQFRSSEAEHAIEKSLSLIGDMRDMGVSDKDERIDKLHQRIAELEKLQTDSQKVLLILAEVENSFLRIIDELRILCDKQARIDGGDYTEDGLQRRYKNLIGDTDACLQKWEGEKREIASDLAVLMQSFRREFLNARDFVKVQLELAKGEDNRI